MLVNVFSEERKYKLRRLGWEMEIKHQLIANKGYQGNRKRVFLFPENELTVELIRRVFFRLHLSSTINFDKNYSTAKKFSYRQTIETTCALR